MSIQKGCVIVLLYRPRKWYVYARNCIGPSYFRQNVYIQRYIFGHKCIFKTKVFTILSAHRTQIFAECPTPYRGITSWARWHVSELALPSTQYPKFRSRPSTKPFGYVTYNLCYVFIFCWLKSKKGKFKLFISNNYVPNRRKRSQKGRIASQTFESDRKRSQTGANSGEQSLTTVANVHKQSQMIVNGRKRC